MALLKQAVPALTNTQLYNAMTSTAIDIETAGTDRDAGFGIFMPIPALGALGAQPVAVLQTGTITASEAPGNNIRSHRTGRNGESERSINEYRRGERDGDFGEFNDRDDRRNDHHAEAHLSEYCSEPERK